MGTIRLGVWNIEWMNDLFTTSGGQVVFKRDNRAVRGPRRGNTVRERIDDVAGVIDALGLDALVVVEGPNRVDELQHFFGPFCRPGKLALRRAALTAPIAMHRHRGAHRYRVVVR